MSYVVSLLLIVFAPVADESASLATHSSMPVKEVTVFKDGHAFVLHEGEMPTNAAGHVELDYLPTPVLGTFWPSSNEDDAKLTSVVAGQHDTRSDRKCLNLRELLESNIGADVIVHEWNKEPYRAAVLDVPAGTGAGPTSTLRPNEKPAERGNVVLLKTSDGVKVVPLDNLPQLTFVGEPRRTYSTDLSRNLLTLKLAWRAKPAASARVGLVYLQRGIRWIPSYRMDIDGLGTARVKLQATLINELTDLSNVTAHLVIGVPSFAFKDTPDPISLQQTFAQLSQYFQEPSRTQASMAGAIMTQAARMSELASADRTSAQERHPELSDAEGTEDLFLFTVQNISLKKGERLVLPVAEYSLPYRDVFTLDLPITPPHEFQRQTDPQQQIELRRLLESAKVMHKIRLENKSQHPLTTAPAILLRDGRILAQSMMTYTSIGASSDLQITAAVDVALKRSEREVKRTPNAMAWRGHNFLRIDLEGKLSLTNHRKVPIDLEVTRYLLGTADSADHEGTLLQTSLFEDDGRRLYVEYPHWWYWYSWPYWWHHLNGVARISWKIKLDPREHVDLGYAWHYFWE